MTAALPPRPFRRVTSWDAGAGTDTLHLECGHRVLRDHRSTAPIKARCVACPRGAK